MGIIISDIINNFSDKLISLSIVNNILSNPIYTSVIISLLCFVLIFFIFDNENAASSSVRIAFYIFIITMSILFIYDKKMLRDMRESNNNNEVNNVLSVVTGSSADGIITNKIFDDEIIPVTINNDFNDNSPALVGPTNAHGLPIYN